MPADMPLAGATASTEELAEYLAFVDRLAHNHDAEHRDAFVEDLLGRARSHLRFPAEGDGSANTVAAHLDRVFASVNRRRPPGPRSKSFRIATGPCAYVTVMQARSRYVMDPDRLHRRLAMMPAAVESPDQQVDGAATLEDREQHLHELLRDVEEETLR
jgi:hypothetical protein